MPDEPTTPTVAPAAPAVTTPAPAATITSPDALAADGNSEPISLEAARKLRSESEALRKRLKTYEDAEQKAKDAQLSEVERITKQHAELQAQYEDMQLELLEQRVFQAVAQQASKHNFAIPYDMIVRLLDWDDIEFDDESGKPTNIETLLEKLAKAAPDLVKQQAAAPQQQQIGVPSLPAMNPGRSTITQPGQQPPGRIPRLSDKNLWKT